MPEDPGSNDAAPAPRRGPRLAFALALGLCAAALAALYLAASGPLDRSLAWWALWGGLAALCGLALLVHAAFIGPGAEAARRVAQLEQALERHSHRDQLTGALNRTAFEQLAERELESLKRYGAGFCGLMLHVEGFGRINATHGYEAGDAVLQELAQLLKGHIRRADLLFRWRSGKFLILATGVSLEQARTFADKLRRLVDAHAFRQGARLTARTGVALALPQDTPEQFSARVKAALELERAGRG